MKLSYIDFNNIEDEKEQARLLAIFTSGVKNILNNGISFSDNFASKIVTVSFDVANAEVNVAHNLGKNPTGYLVLTRSANAVIYDGVSESTTSSIFLRSSAVATCSVMVF